MSKNLVAYYSKSGSNKYLAERAAKAMNADIVEIKPRVTPFASLLFASATGLSWGNRKIGRDLSSYDSILLCGPIWMGQFVAPLKDFWKKHRKEIKKLHFMTCCGSKDRTKDDKFGYAHVLKKIQELAGNKTGELQAFPIELVLPEDKREDDQAMMNARLSDSNFTGEIADRFEVFIKEVTAS